MVERPRTGVDPAVYSTISPVEYPWLLILTSLMDVMIPEVGMDLFLFP